MQKHDHYLEDSYKLLAQARSELEQDDFRQASEKAWGAAALAVKSVAAERNWNHNDHGLLFDVVAQLNDERRRVRLDRLFQAASGLHKNYYEDWLTPEAISEGIAAVASLIERLEQARRPPRGGFRPRTDRQRSRLGRLTHGQEGNIDVLGDESQ